MNEKEFSQILLELKSKAMKQGMCLSIEDIKAAFPEMSDNDEQMGHLLTYFKSARISVGDEAEVEEFLSMEDQHYLDDYMLEIETCEKLEPAKFEECVKKAIEGDMEAANSLMNHFLLEVIPLAKLYSGQGVLLEDLIGEGNLALTEAVMQIGCIDTDKDLIQETEGFVGKYMMDAMEQLINGELFEKRADEEVAEKVNRVADAARQLSEDMMRKVTPQELAENTDIPLDDILEAVRFSGKKIEEIESEEEQ